MRREVEARRRKKAWHDDGGNNVDTS